MSDFINLVDEFLEGEARDFCIAYFWYLHGIDDIVDGDKTDAEFIVKTFEIGVKIFSSPYYQRRITDLYSLVSAGFNCYQDSVNLERRGEEWASKYADVLRQHAWEVLVKVVELERGYDARRAFSIRLREHAYMAHHDKQGNPI